MDPFAGSRSFLFTIGLTRDLAFTEPLTPPDGVTGSPPRALGLDPRPDGDISVMFFKSFREGMPTYNILSRPPRRR